MTTGSPLAEQRQTNEHALGARAHDQTSSQVEKRETEKKDEIESDPIYTNSKTGIGSRFMV